MRRKWRLIDNLLDGTETMRQCGREWLPQAPIEQDTSYQHRLKQTFLLPALSDTIKTCISKPFSNPLQLSDDMPEMVRNWCENIDQCNNKLDTFAKELFKDGLIYGVSYVLVDFAINNATTRADERVSGIRPYFTHVKAKNIISFRSKMINGVEQLTRVRIKEHVFEERDGWSDDCYVEQIRVLYPDKYEIYRTDGNSWELYQQGENTLGVIPLVPFYAEQNGFMLGSPPLQDLAWLNLEHWQSSSVQRNILAIARLTFLFGKGFSEDDFREKGDDDERKKSIVFSPQNAIISLSHDASLQFVEHSGRAIEAGRQDLLDIKEQMTTMGAQKLVRSPGNRTATAEAIETAHAESDLDAMVTSCNHTLKQCFDLMAKWASIPTAGTAIISSEWDILETSNIELQALIDARRNGDISRESYLKELIKKNLLSEDFDIEADKDLLSQENQYSGALEFAQSQQEIEAED